MTISSEAEVRVRSNAQMAKQDLEEALRNVKEAVSELAEVQEVINGEKRRGGPKFRSLTEGVAQIEKPLQEHIALLDDLLTPVLPKKGDPVYDTCWKCGSVGTLTVVHRRPLKMDFDRGMGREEALLITEECHRCGHDREHPVPLNAFEQLTAFH